MYSKKDNTYAQGYQDALADVLAAFDSGGEAQAREWVENNKQAFF